MICYDTTYTRGLRNGLKPAQLAPKAKKNRKVTKTTKNKERICSEETVPVRRPWSQSGRNWEARVHELFSVFQVWLGLPNKSNHRLHFHYGNLYPASCLQFSSSGYLATKIIWDNLVQVLYK